MHPALLDLRAIRRRRARMQAVLFLLGALLFSAGAGAVFTPHRWLAPAFVAWGVLLLGISSSNGGR